VVSIWKETGGLGTESKGDRGNGFRGRESGGGGAGELQNGPNDSFASNSHHNRGEGMEAGPGEGKQETRFGKTLREGG